MTDRVSQPAYVATPQSGSGPGVVVLHAWWGLNDFFRQVCDRLAAEGYVVAAPDLYGGATATTIEQAEQLVTALDGNQARARMVEAIDYVRSHPGVTGDRLGMIGFSMGAAWAVVGSTLLPDRIGAVVLFYGTQRGNVANARAAYLGHFAAGDEWEPDDEVRAMQQAMRDAGRDVTLHWYEGVGHWFFENNRPDAYNPEAAALAWERTLAFLRQQIG